MGEAWPGRNNLIVGKPCTPYCDASGAFASSVASMAATPTMPCGRWEGQLCGKVDRHVQSCTHGRTHMRG